jgi:EAL domain-containing protein (putative c-di-GMP-specific phosphodiesterase class I)
MSHATPFAAARRACTRCETLPAPPSGGGRLHLWSPTAHVAAKVAAHLRSAGIASATIVGDGIGITVADQALGALTAGLGAALTVLEAEETRVLFKREGDAPTPADLPRVESLARLNVLAGSAWLVELMAARRLTAHFQPIVHASDPSRVHGHEALLRGVDAAGAAVSPARLFDAARGAGLLFQLDLAARRAAIAAAHAHALRGSLFINFVPNAIYDPASCLRSTVGAIDAAGLARSSVVFEVVETERAQDADHLKRILDFYRAAGFRVAIDDVGAGYSSLNLIHRLRPDLLKLDMELIRGVHEDPYKATIARKILEVASSLGIETIAEGVECAEELEWARENGATYAQGYHIARPAAVPHAVDDARVSGRRVPLRVVS